MNIDNELSDCCNFKIYEAPISYAEFDNNQKIVKVCLSCGRECSTFNYNIKLKLNKGK